MTRRLVLTALVEDDLDELVALDGHPEVRRGVDPLGRLIPADLNERRRYEASQFLNGGFYGAHERHGGGAVGGRADLGAFVGWFQLTDASRGAGVLELGYRLEPRVWGRGLASEGARAVLDVGLRRPDCRRVIAHALLDNPASIRVMEKVGMRWAADWSYAGLPGVEYAREA